MNVGIALPEGERRLRSKDYLSRFSGELATSLGGTGLDDHRPALHWTHDIERPARNEEADRKWSKRYHQPDTAVTFSRRPRLPST